MNAARPLLRRRPIRAAHLPDSVPPLLQRIYAARGVTSADGLARDLGALADYRPLGGIEAAVELLERALRERWHITLVGDYDADGATSTALAVEVLRACGAATVDYLVPNRFTQGYGLSAELVGQARARGAQLLITVDNGVAAHAGVRAAQAAGMAVLVTDHHLPGATLPPADAMVNPNLATDGFPSKALAGVGVIFYVLSALRARLRVAGWFAERGLAEPKLAELLDLVAVGTVADVVALDGNNRILVEQGLRRIRAGRARPGLRALLRVAGRDPARLVATDLGFAIGPRLNAAGRLDDMALGIECLLARDEARALELAQRLDALNRERRELEQGMREQAMASVEAALARLGGTALPDGLCLFDPQWHEGVVGLVAGRLKERFHRPAAVFAPGEDGQLKGSVRSVPGVHVRDVLADIAARQPDLVRRFGGHAMAAGLTLDPARLDAFADEFAATVTRYADAEALQPVLWSDGELAPDELDLNSAEMLRAGGPWGQGFPEPLFDGVFAVHSAREVGQGHLKLVLRDPRVGTLHDAIAFNYAELGLAPDAGEARFAFRLDVNDYRGERRAQLLVQGYDLALA
ncbi:single-stranded-DNA-specific exonuclease RecJ [Acidihalobacter ferrooxydans]|uniref:Single-stranded-DNA-specific exonuclease RecJ n=1 Tax=Acidihalobacter ferrooxydans TaxID=1765967 RepID=A0A1P8UHZ6_9GAMM|nr:single-stranded-DNA-specific exonuclease RecJ [Acidihalobacter ferrooxydans]APZ43460.1 single-stranded-DNA-specific exonuclease RecJ [Acidihalobacter ferrooxydans]